MTTNCFPRDQSIHDRDAPGKCPGLWSGRRRTTAGPGRFALIAAVVSLFAADRAGAETVPSPLDRQAVLEQALADFEKAVALRNPAAPEAKRLFQSARAGFQSLIASGVHNGRLYYNLANTQLKLGDVGRAIVNYRRGLRLSPGDPQIEKNLESARRLCELRFSKPATSAILETLFFWHYRTALSLRTRAALAGYAAFWLLAMAAVFLPRRVPTLTWLTVAVAVLTAAVGASAAWDHMHADARAGVLVRDGVVVRKGNGAYYEPAFEQTLPPGVEFDVLESRPDVSGETWHLIRLPDEKEGWVADRDIELA